MARRSRARSAEALCELPVRERADERVRERGGVAGGTRSPDSPSVTRSGMPADTAPTTPRPRQNASTTTRPRPSEREGARAPSPRPGPRDLGRGQRLVPAHPLREVRDEALGDLAQRPTTDEAQRRLRHAARRGAMPRRARRPPCSARARRRRARPALGERRGWRREERVEVHERRERRRRLCTELADDARGVVEIVRTPSAFRNPRRASASASGDRSFRSGEP